MPRRSACAPISRWKALRVGAQLGHGAQHGDPALGRRRGEVVEGGPHRHRVGVVAVVDHGHAAGELDHLAAQRGELHVHAARPPASPSARAAATAASVLSRLCGSE